MPSHATHHGVGAALRRLSPLAAALIMAVPALLLLVFIFGSRAILPSLAWIIPGAFIGWLGSLCMSTDTQEGILFDILAGGVGAFTTVLLFGGGGAGLLEPFLASIVGSAGLLAITALVRRGWPLVEKARPRHRLGNR